MGILPHENSSSVKTLEFVLQAVHSYFRWWVLSEGSFKLVVKEDASLDLMEMRLSTFHLSTSDGNQILDKLYILVNLSGVI